MNCVYYLYEGKSYCPFELPPRSVRSRIPNSEVRSLLVIGTPTASKRVNVETERERQSVELVDKMEGTPSGTAT